MAISDSSIIKDVTLKLRALVASGITDPVSSNRPTNSAFVVTDTQREFFTPQIVVHNVRLSNGVIGMTGQGRRNELDVQFDVYSKSPKGRDILAGSLIAVLGSSHRAQSGTLSDGIYDFTITNSFDLDELDDGGLKGFRRKVIETKMFYNSN